MKWSVLKHEGLCQVHSRSSVNVNQFHHQNNKGPEMVISSNLINRLPFAIDECCTSTQSAFAF